MVLVVAAALTITLAGVRATSGIIGPTVLALVLTITVHPLRDWLAKHRLPEWLVTIVLVVAVYTILMALTVSLVFAVGRLAVLIPSYTPQLQDNLNSIADWLAERGVGDQQIRAMVDAFDMGKILSLASGVFGAVLGILSNLFFIITLVLFMAFDSTNVRSVLDKLRGRKPDLINALDHFAEGTRSYMAVSAVFGLIVAIIDGVVLWALGVPGAFVWAVLAFVTNFSPNIGFVIGVVPPALIALLEGGPGLMLAVLVVYSVINVVIQSVIQPRYVGDKVGLTATFTMLSLVFWAWALGPLGALLAVPMSLLMRALLVEADPSARWVLPLISGKWAHDEVTDH
jgi:predicted PurR-regulated permease PerM